MTQKKTWAFGGAFALMLVLAFGFSVVPKNSAREVHVGYLSNITHAQAVLGRAEGKFEKALGPETPIHWTVFNAGSSIIEALFAGKIDLAYIGPSPAVNGFVKSHGEALKVVAGSASGGAALVVRKDSGIQSEADFKGKKIASPGLGNTQDVSLRAWLSSRGFTLKEKGGDVHVLPIANADQVTLFARKEIDAAWTVEPWVSILVQQAGGRIFLDEASLWPEGEYATTLLIARKDFLDKNPTAVKKFLRTHLDVTRWILQNESQAKKLLNSEMKKLTHKSIPEPILSLAFAKIRFTLDPMKDSVQQQAESAYVAGFLKEKPDLEALFDLKLLEEVLA